MNRIVFICPYFGEFPKEQMTLWLQSCEKNPDIDWLIFTNDNYSFEYPPNVIVNKMTFEEIKNYIQSKFEYNIKLDTPYKLCDFKPTYGYIFSEFIKRYDFWGHCDISDCIFGQIRHFITDKILGENDKIGFLGHLTLYKNSKEVNKRFMLKTQSGISLSEILGTKENKAFDEINEYSINTIYKEYNYKIKRIDDIYSDISPMKYAFQEACYDENYKHFYKKNEMIIFEWNNGELYKCIIKDNIVHKKEIMYIHFQKRSMHKEFHNKVEKYYIVPNKFICNVDLNNVNTLKKYMKNRIYFKALKIKFKSIKYRIQNAIKYKK